MKSKFNPYLSISLPLFQILLSLKDNNLSFSDSVREKIVKNFIAFEYDCYQQKLNMADVQAVKYAITAFMDEVIMLSQLDDSKKTFYEPLQVQFFGEHTAGEMFFNKLQLHREKANRDVLEIFYLCLQFGFKGAYALANKNKLIALISELRVQLEALNKVSNKEVSLAFHPEGQYCNKSANMKTVKICAGAFVAATLCFYLGFGLVIDSRAKKINEQLQTSAMFKSTTHMSN